MRINKLRERMRKERINSLLLTKPADISWLSGFTGTTAFVVVTETSALFVTDGRYEEQVKGSLSEIWEIKIVTNYRDFFQSLAKYISIYLQPSCELYIYKLLVDLNVQVKISNADILQEARMVKTPDEIALLKDEYVVAAKGFLNALESFKYGDSERKWAAQLEYNMKLQGATCPSFETIVASGVRGALPHGVASDKIIDPADAVTIDFGSKNLYNSDYTRVVYNGKDSEVLKIIDTVRQALETAMGAVKPGVKCSHLDILARKVIDDAGYSGFFNHGLGHGVGTEVHELPHVNGRTDTIIEPEMVFTIEPGIYIPGKYGIRLEETVRVTETGCELISFMLNKYVYTID